ncbi:MAG: glycosyltransferase family 39 protein, partial [Blastocatellia bacterium]
PWALAQAAPAAMILLAAAVSVVSFMYFYSHGMTNVYGDGISHLNIARKAVDIIDHSIWQRYVQIGSPWLPLQTVLVMPLVANDHLWRTGLAGSIVSMVCFVIAAASLYFIARRIYANGESNSSRFLPILAVLIFILNPSALYFQSTPMSEMVFMAALLAAVLMFQRWMSDQSWSRLSAAGAAMTVATLARYEAWPVAAAAVLLVALLYNGGFSGRAKSALIFALFAGLGPVYWLWHNHAIYGNALEFLDGPNSARGLYAQNSSNLGWANIFVGHVLLDILLMTVTVAVCVGPIVLLLAAIGAAKLVGVKRRRLHELVPVGLLAVPFLFHILSLYRGEIQIFPLSAFGLLNVRYGIISLLPAAVLAPACILSRRRLIVAALVVALAGAQYGYMVSDGFSDLAVYQEGFRNGVNSRTSREIFRAADFLRSNPPKQLILMYSGELGPIVPRGGLEFAEIIHEGTRQWWDFKDQIPAAVETVIVEKGDELDHRLAANSALSKNLLDNFRERYRDGGITIFERVDSHASS